MYSYFIVHLVGLEIKELKEINGIKLVINTLEKGGKAYFCVHKSIVHRKSREFITLWV